MVAPIAQPVFMMAFAHLLCQATRTCSVLLALALLTHSSCAKRRSCVLSLLDQIPEGSPAGEWECLAFLGGPREVAANANGLVFEQGAAVQRDSISVLSLDVQTRGSRHVTIGVTYGTNPGPGTVVEARLYGDGGRHAVESSTPTGRLTELHVRAPLEGARRLSLHHRTTRGAHLSIQSVAVLSLDRPGDDAARRRASALLKCLPFQEPGSARMSLQLRRFPFELDRCRRDGVILASGDTLAFDLHAEAAGSRLDVWVVRLLSAGRTRLSVDLHDGTGWVRAGTWGRSQMEARQWVKLQPALHVAPGTERLRFSLTGRGAAILLAEPVLLQNSGRPSGRPNLIVVDHDTMRADRLGCYGYTERPTSVALDSILERRGFYVFRRAYSAASWTLPATAKFLTSRYWDIEEEHALPRCYTTLAELLREDGYFCAAFTGGVVMRSTGLEQGFHEYWFTQQVGKVENVLPQSMEWLRTNTYSPFFLFLHTYETHVPYTRDVFCRELPCGTMGDISGGEPLFEPHLDTWFSLPPTESLYVQAAYDGGVRHACDATAGLFGLLDRLNLWENSVVVILSDHGEEFWDHFPAFAKHGHSLYGEQLNVPLLLHVPWESRRRLTHIEQPVSTVDLVPTVLDLLSVPSDHPFDGVSLLPALRGKRLERHVPILAISWRMRDRSIFRACAVLDSLKYIETMVDSAQLPEGSHLLRFLTPRRELYVLPRDPSEEADLAKDRPGDTRIMEKVLTGGLRAAIGPESREGAATVSQDMPEALKRQLAAMGYVE
jgi:arylsulfatase A-like enzyme